MAQTTRKEIRIVIPGEPRPLQRHRHSAGRAYDTQANIDAKALIQGYAFIAMRTANHRTLFGGPLHLTLHFGLTRPKTIPASRTWPDSKPDIDNLIKLVCDACNGVVWIDDAQIVDCSAQKRYDKTPHTMIVVRQLTAAEAA